MVDEGNGKIFRGPVQRTSASVTRFFVMFASSASRKRRGAIIARDLSPGGVRLSGAIRPSPDVIQKVRGPPGGEELGKIRDGRCRYFELFELAIWRR